MSATQSKYAGWKRQFRRVEWIHYIVAASGRFDLRLVALDPALLVRYITLNRSAIWAVSNSTCPCLLQRATCSAPLNRYIPAW